MARKHRVVVPGGWYHVLNRGNRREDIFRTDTDRRRLLGHLAELPERFQIEVHAFVLMDNHYHLLLRTRDAMRIPALFGHRFRFNPDRIPAEVGQRSDSIRTAFRSYPDSCSERSDAAGRQLPRHGHRVKPDTGFSAGQALPSASRGPADRSPMGVAPLRTGLSSPSSRSAA